MPVLVHAADRPLARALARRLLEDGGQVRATSSSGVGLLRAEGIFTASCDPDDEGTLEAALTRVHTLVVLLGGLGRADVDAVVREGTAAARAAEGADVQRVILVTLAGADPDASDLLRRAHGEVAQTFAAAGPPSIEVRTGLVDTSASSGMLAAAGLPPEVRARMVAPVVAHDLVELVVAIDHARSRADGGHLVIAADGPVRRTLDEHLSLSGSAVGRLTGRRVPTSEERAALIATLDGPWWTDDPLVPDAWTLFGVPGTTHGDTATGEAAPADHAG